MKSKKTERFSQKYLLNTLFHNYTRLVFHSIPNPITFRHHARVSSTLKTNLSETLLNIFTVITFQIISIYILTLIFLVDWCLLLVFVMGSRHCCCCHMRKTVTFAYYLTIGVKLM